jgi:hypothetical protein
LNVSIRLLANKSFAITKKAATLPWLSSPI